MLLKNFVKRFESQSDCAVFFDMSVETLRNKMSLGHRVSQLFDGRWIIVTNTSKISKEPL